MIDLVNMAVAALTIVFGAFGFLAPRTTMNLLDLRTGASNMGLSEMRAPAGGLFVAFGAACLIVGDPMLYLALGIAYGGAAMGRGLSILLDSPPMSTALKYFGTEAVLAAWLIWANWAS